MSTRMCSPIMPSICLRLVHPITYVCVSYTEGHSAFQVNGFMNMELHMEIFGFPMSRALIQYLTLFAKHLKFNIFQPIGWGMEYAQTLLNGTEVLSIM